MKRIYIDTFIQQWCKQYEDWYGKFSAKNIDEHVYFGSNLQEDWFFIWQGEHAIFGNTELIPGETLVYGCRNEPKFVTMQQFKKTFVFTNHHPILSRPNHSVLIKEGSTVAKRLEEIKTLINAA